MEEKKGKLDYIPVYATPSCELRKYKGIQRFHTVGGWYRRGKGMGGFKENK